MPWPFVPPEPDLPSPIHRDPLAGRLTACAITLNGLDPHREQSDLRCLTGSGPAALWVPHHLGEYRYQGVLIAPLAATDQLTLKWLADGGKSADHKLSLKTVDQWPASVSGGLIRASAGKLQVTVKCAAPASGKYQLVVAPFAPEFPILANHAAYAAAGAWLPVSGPGKHTLDLPDIGAPSYAAFVARGMPTRAQVASAVTLVTLR